MRHKRAYRLVLDGTVLCRCIPQSGAPDASLDAGCLLVDEENGGLVIPAGVTEIRESAFRDLSPDMGLHLGDWISAMGRGVWYEFFSPQWISLPAGVRSIGASAFRGCRSLKAVFLPDSLEELGASAFESCSSLAAIRVSAGITALPWGVFRDCGHLALAELPESLSDVGNYAFARCSSLEEIRIPDQVERIGSSAFQACERLTQVRLPKRLRVLEAEAFAGCASLKRIALPQRLRSLGSGCFRDCVSLEELALPRTLRSLGSRCFASCQGLKTLRIPAGVEYLGEDCLSGSGLQNLQVEGTDLTALLGRGIREPAGMILEAPYGFPAGLPLSLQMAWGKGFAGLAISGYPFSPEQIRDGCALLELILLDIWDCLPARTLLLEQKRLSRKGALRLTGLAAERRLPEAAAALLEYIGENWSQEDLTQGWQEDLLLPDPTSSG